MKYEAQASTHHASFVHDEHAIAAEHGFDAVRDHQHGAVAERLVAHLPNFGVRLQILPCIQVSARKKEANHREQQRRRRRTTLAVASSSAMMRERLSKARARHSSCRSPTLKFSAVSVTLANNLRHRLQSDTIAASR